MTKNDTTPTHDTTITRRTAANPAARRIRIRSGFTLIELLAVIAIIGILATIILATIGRVRSMAHQTVCTSNLRQWGTALQLYANDNKEKIPYEGSDDYLTWAEAKTSANRDAWFNILPPYANYPGMDQLNVGLGGMTLAEKKAYFKNKGRIYLCQADTRPLVATYMSPSYMMNSQLYNAGGKGYTYGSPVGNGEDGRRITLQHLRDNRESTPLSQIAFMADAGAANPNGNTPRLRGHEDLADMANDNAAGKPNSYLSGVHYRHNGKFNVVFFDASVRTFKPGPARGKSQSGLIWHPWGGYIPYQY